MAEDEETSESEVYDEEGREDMVESDGMSPGEEGFMSGYDEEPEKKKEVKEEKEEED